MRKNGKIIDAPLCGGCADLLRQIFILREIDGPLENDICPWCQRRNAELKYRLTVPNKQVL